MTGRGGRFWWLLGVVSLWCGLAGARAQSEPYARWLLARPLAQLGAPSTLVLEVAVPVGASVSLPTLPEDWSPFTIVQAGEVVLTEEAGLTVYRLTLVVVPWQVGDFFTPSTTVAYQSVGESATRALPVEPALFSVPSVLDDRPSLRPAKPLIAMRVVPVGVWVVLGTGALALAVVGGVSLHLWRAARARDSHVAVGLAQQTLRALEALAAQSPSAKDVVVLTQMGDILRGYIGDRAGIPSERRTTRELMVALREGRVLAPPQWDALRALLDTADLAKFAPDDVLERGPVLTPADAARWVAMVEASLAQRGR